MLTDSDRLLIAAATDGPVPPEQAAPLARLLATSSAARLLATELVADRRRLAELPRLAAPAGFAGQMDADLPIIRPSLPLVVSRRPAWLPYATAAGVFLALAAGAYQLTGRRDQPGPAVAAGPPPTVRIAPARATRPEPLPVPQPDPEPVPVIAARTVPTTSELAPAPRPVGPPALFAAGLFREIEPPAEVSARLPLLSPVGDLDTADVRTRTVATWGSSPAVRLDLFVPDVSAALPAVQAVAKACGWTVSTDATAQALLKAKQPATFALYADAVTAEDGGQLLAGLAAEQRGGTKLGHAHLSAASPADLREMKDLLGGEAKPPARPTKDDSTIGQVVKQFAGKRPALLFAVSPPDGLPAVGSKEVRAFADSRIERKPGTIPLLVVVRPLAPN